MQHIGLELKNERGELIERSELNFALLLTPLWKRNDFKEFIKGYPFLAGIDPYGDTYFNHYQTPYVIEELERLKQDPVTYTVQKEITDTIEFLKKVDQGISAKFIGDQSGNAVLIWGQPLITLIIGLTGWYGNMDSNKLCERWDAKRMVADPKSGVSQGFRTKGKVQNFLNSNQQSSLPPIYNSYSSSNSYQGVSNVSSVSSGGSYGSGSSSRGDLATTLQALSNILSQLQAALRALAPTSSYKKV